MYKKPIDNFFLNDYTCICKLRIEMKDILMFYKGKTKQIS